MSVRILHCHSSFSLGGKEARAVALMNAFGARASHVVLSGVPEAMGARAAIAPGIAVEFPGDAPSLTGRPAIARYRALADYARRFDLILTYNWGAMDAVMARRMFSAGMPPLVHHEDGFNADEARGLKTERTLMRRLALPSAEALVVPSQTLERIALDTWKQPVARVHRIANGIAISRYGGKVRTGAIPGLKPKRGEIVVGTVAGLRPVKNLPRLVRAALAIPGVRLAIVGEGPDRDAIVAAATAMNAADRLVLPGFMADPANWIGAFDVFALSSDSEQFPIALVEAMAAGLPVATTHVGDVAEMLPPEQHVFVTQRDDYALSAALRQLVADPVLRARLGAANRARAIADFDARAMISRYAALYGAVLGIKGAQFAELGL